jgi:hypothetical protein
MLPGEIVRLDPVPASGSANLIAGDRNDPEASGRRRAPVYVDFIIDGEAPPACSKPGRRSR